MPLTALDGTAGDDTPLDGGEAGEHIRGLDGADQIRGMGGQDFVNGNDADDFVNGNVGRDEVHGGQGNDEVMGGSDDDVVLGDMGDDHVLGGMGDDRLVGGEGNDVLEGGEGNDRYTLDGLGNDLIDDVAGIDAARCLPGVRALDDLLAGGDRVLVLSTGGTVRFSGNTVESVLGCQ